MKFLELQTEFMIPLWRRVVLVLVCLIWSVIEFINHSVSWGVVVLAMGLYALWQLFFNGWPSSEPSTTTSATTNNNSSPAEDTTDQDPSLK